MYTAAALVILLALTVGIAVLRAAKKAIRLILRHGRKSRDKKDPPEGKKSLEESHEESLSEKNSQPLPEPLPEDTRHILDVSAAPGITECFSTEEGFKIDCKQIADLCTRRGPLTCLEYNNRFLGEDAFKGFNLVVEDGHKAVLTYGGLAIASLTRAEREAEAVINGETVKGAMPAWRINTFPPRRLDWMGLTDIERMVDAVDRMRACRSATEALETMVSVFTEGTNLRNLKDAVGPAVQSRESERPSKAPEQAPSPRKHFRRS